MNFIRKTLRILGLIISLAGSLLTLAQIFLLLFNQDTICFNDGCEIVETLTTVSPVFFNIAGLLFFQAVFWTLYYTKTEKTYWTLLNKTLLLAGIAAEGVLVGYQHFVINIFCSYCLIILAIIVALNLLQNYRHILYCIAIFAAIQIGFAALQFSAPRVNGGFMLDNGTVTTMKGLHEDRKLYLFFSSTCVHCEEVIETLEAYPECTILFNPVDKVEQVNIPVEYSMNSYDSEVNKSFLGNFGINEIPALLVSEGGNFSLIRGKQNIINTIQQNCYPETSQTLESTSESPAISPLDQLLPPQPADEENCTIDTDCEDPIVPLNIQPSYGN